MSDHVDYGSAKIRLVVHGHFYQPPRENPWTNEIPVDPTAEPWSNWNARIADECYVANAHAGLYEGNDKLGEVNNYEYLSFNAGPTLISWLERERPEVLDAMCAADRKRDCAIAQGYGHLILPLCNDRDLATQIKWGMAEFAYRYGRKAVGMWLPEAAVNDRVLSAMAELGVKSVILASYQASEIRTTFEHTWTKVDSEHSPRGGPYRWLHPNGSGSYVDLFFYDPDLSQQLAFGSSGLSAGDFARSVRSHRESGGITMIATDGETFGHHQHFVDRMLAYFFTQEAKQHAIEVVNIGDLLDEPVIGYARVVESSWSCAHGVGRWSRDCGCAIDPGSGSQQQWRAPLRRALDILRDFGAYVFDDLGAACFERPWEVRDAYVSVLNGEESLNNFLIGVCFNEHVVATAGQLLQAQYFSMAMYTSCGWFFDDISRQETMQVLRYAARVFEIYREIGVDVGSVYNEFLATLAKAPSNDPAVIDGQHLWLTQIVSR